MTSVVSVEPMVPGHGLASNSEAALVLLPIKASGLGRDFFVYLGV